MVVREYTVESIVRVFVVAVNLFSKFVKRLVVAVELFTELIKGLVVAVFKLCAEPLGNLLAVVAETLRSPHCRIILTNLVLGLMKTSGVILIGVFINDVSLLLQNDVSNLEKNHVHIMLKTVKSKVTYSVLVGVQILYKVYDYWWGANQHYQPNPQQLSELLANLVLQSHPGGDRVHPPSDTASQDQGSSGGTSTRARNVVMRATVEVSVTVEDDSPDASPPYVVRFEPYAITRGSRVLHKYFDINSQAPEELDNCISQIVDSMRLAHDVDKDCFLQLGSYAVFKYTDAGPRMWRLQEHWVPKIIDIRRQWKIVDSIYGRPARWIIRGLNLQGATVRAATMDAMENFKVINEKHDKGVDILICEEPHIIQNSAPTFREKLFITVFRVMEVEEGVCFKLRSEAKDVQRAYLISAVDVFIPDGWIAIISIALQLLGLFSRSTFGKQKLSFKLLPIPSTIVDNYFRANLGTPFSNISQHWPSDRLWYGGRLSNKLGTEDTWSHLWRGLEIYLHVYVVYLLIIIFIFLWKIVLRAHDQPEGRQSLLASPITPVTDSLCEVCLSPSVTKTEEDAALQAGVHTDAECNPDFVRATGRQSLLASPITAVTDSLCEVALNL
ncbi:unnamed protein product [Calypogeia fissa]